MNEIVRIFGPWGLLVLAMAWLLKYMVVDKLTAIMTSLKQLLAGHDDHHERIITIETIMRQNGCMDGTSCDRRKEPRASTLHR